MFHVWKFASNIPCLSEEIGNGTVEICDVGKYVVGISTPSKKRLTCHLAGPYLSASSPLLIFLVQTPSSIAAVSLSDNTFPSTGVGRHTSQNDRSCPNRLCGFVFQLPALSRQSSTPNQTLCAGPSDISQPKSRDIWQRLAALTNATRNRSIWKHRTSQLASQS